MSYTDFLNKVIDGSWESNEEGFIVYTPTKTIEYYHDLTQELDIFLADRHKIENLLVDSCLHTIKSFAETENNREVYAAILYIDTECGHHGLSFNTEEAYKKMISEKYGNNIDVERSLIYGVRYNEGDFEYRYFGKELANSLLQEIMDAYYSINVEHMIGEVSRKIAFEKSFFEEQFVQVGINVVNRLKESSTLLNRTEDFIFYVTLHDIDEQTIVKLMKKTVPLPIFNKLFIEK